MPINPASIRYGMVLRAMVDDPFKKNEKPRTVVMLGPVPVSSNAQVFSVVCITGTFYERDKHKYIPLPWDPRGHRSTGLYKECVAMCDWLRPLRAEEVDEAIGYLSTSLMDQIEARIRVLNPAHCLPGKGKNRPPPAPPATPSPNA